MKRIPAKNLRLRLDANSYHELHRQVLERDGWRCQVCGSKWKSNCTITQGPTALTVSLWMARVFRTSS